MVQILSEHDDQIAQQRVRKKVADTFRAGLGYPVLLRFKYLSEHC